MRYALNLIFCLSLCLLVSCDDDKDSDTLQSLATPEVSIGDKILSLEDPLLNTGSSLTAPILVKFSVEIDVLTAQSIVIQRIDGTSLAFSLGFSDNNKTLVIQPQGLVSNQTYLIIIDSSLKGSRGETFKGLVAQFSTGIVPLAITSLKIGGMEYLVSTSLIQDIPQTLAIEIIFSYPVNPSTVTSSTVRVTKKNNAVPLIFSYSDNNKKLTITSSQTLIHLSRYQLSIQNSVKGAQNEPLAALNKIFYTVLDHSPKMPLLPNDEDDDTNNDNDLLSVVQKQTFKYFYDFAHPTSGMARERNDPNSANTVTSGGSGFGIMALIVGMERNFITRTEGLDRMDRILDFLETADRFHGVWPHWMNGNNGDVIPFSPNDNGGDLVETSFLVQGLLTFRQYLNTAVPAENDLVNRINVLWHAVEWDWYRKCDPTCKNVLYWHWSPDKGWIMNFALSGYFEEQITYFLAAASPTHSIPKIVYSNGYGKNGAIVKNKTFEGIVLPLEDPAPLFWVQYSYLGLDPHFNDDYTNYWTQNTNATLINYKYCIRNPKNFVGYSDECWGLTASDNHISYSAHSPGNDLGVISPTAALSSFPYTPTESMKALKFFYYTIGDRLWGPYGFYDAFNVTEDWYASSYLAIDQGPIVVMIENYRTGLLWELFMSAPEIQVGLEELDFTY